MRKHFTLNIIHHWRHKKSVSDLIVCHERTNTSFHRPARPAQKKTKARRVRNSLFEIYQDTDPVLTLNHWVCWNHLPHIWLPSCSRIMLTGSFCMEYCRRNLIDHAKLPFRRMWIKEHSTCRICSFLSIQKPSEKWTQAMVYYHSNGWSTYRILIAPHNAKPSLETHHANRLFNTFFAHADNAAMLPMTNCEGQNTKETFTIFMLKISP